MQSRFDLANSYGSDLLNLVSSYGSSPPDFDRSKPSKTRIVISWNQSGISNPGIRMLFLVFDFIFKHRTKGVVFPQCTYNDDEWK